VLDVAGYNYAEVRYQSDADLFPSRVIVGSETFPDAIDRNWRLVLDHDHVIGDFTWTGWDYLGEVGIGRIEYEGDAVTGASKGLEAGYPWRYASCGDIDVTGHRLPISYYREIVFGRRTDPYIAVRPPQHHGAQVRVRTPWSWSSAVESWTWAWDEGTEVTVEVYADADEVELLQDGRSVGRRPVGSAHRYRTEFEVRYHPGELTAVAFRAGHAVGRSSLRAAAGDISLVAELDRDQIVADDGDLAFVRISFSDSSGIVHSGVDRAVEITIDGPGVLQGLGSAAPASEESFLDQRCTTYQGRALAVVRPTAAGIITVTVAADGYEAASVTCVAREP
jgi:beta-galactosidase